jgi:hypothetical protein
MPEYIYQGENTSLHSVSVAQNTVNDIWNEQPTKTS